MVHYGPVFDLEGVVRHRQLASYCLPLRWQPVAAARPAMSPVWWQWLASRDSLTERLMAAGAGKSFRVRLLNQYIGRPRHDEAHALGIKPYQYAWLREVALCLDERPWVVARSVAPLAQVRGQRLERLGERSLGSWLFRQPGLKRSPVEVTRAQAPFHPAFGPWGRRSVFRHGNFAVLVQEFFLDGMRDDLRLSPR